MPLQIQIPERGRAGLVALLSLADDASAELCKALSELPARLRTRDIPKQIAGKVRISTEQLREITDLLISLYAVRDAEEASVADFSDAVFDAMRESGDPIFELILSAVSKTKARLYEFMSIEGSLGTTAKALSVAYENIRHYHSGRVLTDARPIFSTDPSAPPTAFVILHTLRFEVHENGEDREWFVSMNSADLDDLSQVIERAKVKEKSLASVIKRTNITLLEWEE